MNELTTNPLTLSTEIKPISNALVVKLCTFHSAKFAVLNWHYSKAMPAGKLVKYGVWENNKFIGAVIYGRGANNNAAKGLGLKVTECAELVRVALCKHTTPVTRIVSITLKLLKRDNPGLKLIFSYADKTNQNHKGTIYRAGNWKYHGIRVSQGGHFLLGNKLVHNRSISSKYGKRNNIPDRIKAKLQKAPKQEKHFFTYALR